MNDYGVIIFLVIFAGAMIWFFKFLGRKGRWTPTEKDFPPSWRMILLERIPFYIDLSEEERKQFEFKVNEFLVNVRVTGIETNVDDVDRILVASSAVIPIFRFPDWQYLNLHEVLLYPAQFDRDFKTEGGQRSILGMVGTGYMEGKMILSKPSLHHGFRNESDKMNTAVHEFVHLIDKADGVVDGVPKLLLEKQYTIPWLDLIHKNIDEIYKGSSDINPYGATNRAEFFSVISEYFFENPELLEEKHPDLYDLLKKIFHTDMAEQHKLHRESKPIGRNDKCPCGSGKKFKKCCGKDHF